MLEEAILFIVAMLGNDAYPGKITAELSVRTSRPLSVGSVHSMLDKFEKQGVLVSSSVKTKPPSRRKRIYSLTENGRREKNIPYQQETLKQLLRLHSDDRL